jgi:hypothetical protein
VKPIIKPPDPVDPDEERRKREDAAYARFRRIAVGDLPTAPTPDWRGRLRPAGSPNPRQALIEDYRALREAFTKPVRPSDRQYLGPPPSDPQLRIVEGQKKSGLFGGIGRQGPKT